MRPYLAIIQDSFREAFASRVLWVLLVLITLLLLALAPMGYREQMTCDLRDHDIRDLPRFVENFRDQANEPEPSPSKHVLNLLEPSMREAIEEFRMPEEGEVGAAFKMLGTLRKFPDALNGAMKRRDFYDAEAWGDVRLVSDEGQELVDREPESLSDEEVGRLNRLWLESAYPDQIAASPATSLKFRYLIYDFGQPWPVRKSEFQRSMESIVEWISKWLVGTLGVFVAILVTASIIPQTFDPGSLNLLLSKPIWRWLLFLAKFLGGCAFILLLAGYLVAGLWLILGTRFGLWDPRILLSIPVYVFMFAIYYAVSALAGLLWRNAIVSVIVTIVFWMACFTVGVAKSTIEQFVLDKARLVRLLPAEQDLISVNEIGVVQRWNSDARQWEEIFQSDDDEALQRRMAVAFMPAIPPDLQPLGPVYDASTKRLVIAERLLSSGQIGIRVASQEQGWLGERGVNASMGTRAMLSEPDGGILFASSTGLYRLAGDPLETDEPLKVFGFNVPLPSRGPFDEVGPETPVVLSRASAVAMHPATGELAIYNRGRVTILRPDEQGRYQRRLEQRLETESTGDVVLAFAGDTLMVGRRDGRILAYDAESLQERASFLVEGKNQPRFITAAPDGGRFAVVFHHRRLWVYERATNELTPADVAGQKDIACCFFPSANRILVVDRGARLTEYQLPGWKRLERRAPKLSFIERAYRYVLQPLYTVFPKPGELDKTVQYILTEKETEDTVPGDLGTAQRELHPWRPVWSSLAFMVVMLGLGCLHLHRQDF